MKSLSEIRPEWVDKGRLPFLDSLRVIAMVMVMAEHFGVTGGSWVGKVFTGHLGVTLFFVISGFLITLLLLREHKATGHISLKSFYYRRVLRIFPAYYAYIIVGLILSGLGLVFIGRTFWISGLTYMMCYMPHFGRGWYLTHTWSLAVEEHFYILWPLILTVLTPVRAWKVILAYLVCTPVIRYGIWSMHQDWLDIYYCSLTQMSSIGVGCLLAFTVRGEALVWIGDKIKANPGLIVMAGVILVILSSMAGVSGKYMIVASDPVSAIACCMIIAGLLYVQNSAVFALMNNRFTAFLGALSYSLYLWQQPFTGPTPVVDWATPWRLIGVFAAALTSYYIIERPFLRMKDKVSIGFLNLTGRKTYRMSPAGEKCSDSTAVIDNQ